VIIKSRRLLKRRQSVGKKPLMLINKHSRRSKREVLPLRRRKQVLRCLRRILKAFSS
jgi:hypothetical protein